ncbi:acetyl-CoA synthetase-like protein [Coprinellus micaceus]|uniref:Acetyl-CoA synthetase-like protein n=1 Tax=Coprinellus micaceus TaxID=71717 RepID=A0A4Y7SEB0_COPMI|nr:acetyl-CoA synthetase-like protein [Coprinellus micaceus]
MAIIKSLYPEPPTAPDLNAHYSLFKRPDQAQWPADFTLHVDALTGEKRTYKEFLARVNDLATALGGPAADGCLGIGRPGEKIGIMMENSSDYVSLIHACLIITTPFVLISSYSTPFELKHALTLSQASHLVVDEKFLPVALQVSAEIGLDATKIYVGCGNADGRRSIEDFVRHVRSKSIPFIGVRPAKRDTLAYLVFSSGTSGLPKAVMISHGNIIYSLSQAAIVAMAAQQVKARPPPPTPEGLPVVLAFLPLHHTYGLHTYSFRIFLAPMTLVFMKRWDIEVALTAIPRYSVTILTLIPSIVHQLVHHPKFTKTDWSKITSMGSGAAYLPPKLSAQLMKVMPKGVDFGEGYGMSEGTIAAITQPLPGTLGGRGKRIPGSTGILLPGVAARIVKDDGGDAKVNEPGELWLQSDNVAIGYYNNEKANKETFVNGWLRTGDKFRVDKDGTFWFADRAKDTLKVSGAQVSPVEIENCLLANPDKLIIDASVAGVQGHGRTSDEKVPRAWIVLSSKGKKLGEKEAIRRLDRWIKKSLSKYKWVRGGYEVVDEIPKSPTGKVLRRVLVDKYENSLSEKVKAKL